MSSVPHTRIFRSPSDDGTSIDSVLDSGGPSSTKRSRTSVSSQSEHLVLNDSTKGIIQEMRLLCRYIHFAALIPEKPEDVERDSLAPDENDSLSDEDESISDQEPLDESILRGILKQAGEFMDEVEDCHTSDRRAYFRFDFENNKLRWRTETPQNEDWKHIKLDTTTLVKWLREGASVDQRHTRFSMGEWDVVIRERTESGALLVQYK